MEEIVLIRLLFVAGLFVMSAVLILLAYAVAALRGISSTPRERPTQARPTGKSVAVGSAR